MGIQKLISKAQQTAPHILRAALAAMILFPGTSFGKQQYDDSVICENDRDGQVRKFASELVQKASYTKDENGQVPIRDIPKTARKWFGALLTLTNDEASEVNGEVGIGNANGVMVSPCHMLTNHHVAFGSTPLPRNDKTPAVKKQLASKYTVTLTNVTSKVPGKLVTAKPVEWGDRYEAGHTAEDWVLLELSECKGKETGWVDIKESVKEDIINQKLAGVWYFQGEASENVKMNYPCAIDLLSTTGKAVRTTCGSEGGSSGSGIYQQESGQRPKLVALQVSSRRADGEITHISEGGKNSAVSTNSFYSRISSILKDSKKKYVEELRASGRNVSDEFNPAFD